MCIFVQKKSIYTVMLGINKYTHTDGLLHGSETKVKVGEPKLKIIVIQIIW